MEGTAAWRESYRGHRLREAQAVKATAREFDARPPEVRRAVRTAESDLQDHGEV